MHYIALLLLLLPMQHLLAMDMQTVLNGSAQFAQQVGATMSPELLTVVRQSASSSLPHPLFTRAVRLEALQRVASMGQQQKSKFAHTMLRGARTGLYYSGKGLYYGGEGIIRAVAQMGKIVLAWAGAGFLSLAGLTGAVAASIFVYKNVSNRLGNLEQGVQTLNGQMGGAIGQLTHIQGSLEQQGEQLDDIEQSVDTVGNDVLALGNNLTAHRGETRQGFVGVNQQLGVLTTEQQELAQNVAAHRAETSSGFAAVDATLKKQGDYLTTQFEQAAQYRQSEQLARELQKTELLERLDVLNKNTEQNAGEIARVQEMIKNLEKGGIEVQTSIARNHAELLTAIRQQSASSSQLPLLIIDGSPSRGRLPSPQQIAAPSRPRSQSPPKEFPGIGSFVDRPFGQSGQNDFMKAFSQSGLLHNGSRMQGNGSMLRLTHKDK